MVTRRTVLLQGLTLGSAGLTLWRNIEIAWAATCGLPATDADCSLPSPGQAQRFIPNEPNVQVRFSAAEMADPARQGSLKRLRDGTCAIRDLPKTDVISWTKLIAQHCTGCDPGNPRNVHYDWQFLPWHRCLLYFVERAIRKFSGDDSARLVYWDWENANSRTLPQIFADLDQPLYWSNRNVTGPKWPLSNAAVDVQPLLALPSFPMFGGTATQRTPVPATFSGPHANVHNAFRPGDMADLRFSPRDPLFYAHHANIDRMWSSWVAAQHQNSDFGEAKVFFYDENRQWRYVLMNDLRDETKLGYRYSTLMSPKVPVAGLKPFPLVRLKNRVRLAGPTLELVKVPRPSFLLIENLRGLERFPRAAVDFGVFVGTPAIGTVSTTSPGFLGVISRVTSVGHEGHQAPLSGVFDVTERLGKLAEAHGGSLDLSVASLDDSGKTTARPIPLAADRIFVIA